MSQNVINQGVLIRFVGNPHVHQDPEVTVLLLVVQFGAHEVLLNV